MAAGGDLAKVAVEQKLIDKLGDKTAFDRFVASRVGTDETPSPDSFKSIDYDDFIAANPLDTSGSPIGVITIAGEIIGGDTGPGMAASGRIAELIYTALDEDEIKALVVRVDSPGGSAFASEEIRLALLEARKKKLPIVVSMGDVAASGGYWVATAGDHIFAEPETITGSIGVFAILPSFEKALAKWGVTADGVQTTPLSGEPNFVGGFSEDLNVILQSGVENSYRDFVTLVAKARGKTPTQVDEIGQGRVWDGGTARQLGLVDGFGGMQDALAEAAKRAGLAEGDYHPKYLDPQSRFSWLPFEGIPFVRTEKAPVTGAIGWAAQRQRAIFGQAVATAQALLVREDVQALCLECGTDARRNTVASASWIERLLGYSFSAVP